MQKLLSPLRYPGGKSCLQETVADILRINRLSYARYVEPYAGGCGLALSLLFGSHVSEIRINDIDVAIWAFWHSVLEHTEEFVALVMNTPVTIDEWQRQRQIHAISDKKNPLALGFATFFLNRTNRSGVIKGAGVIGGIAQQGTYKIDCRFNREDLSRRIRRIAKYKSRIHLSNMDALMFMSRENAAKNKTFFCIDPPYFVKGSSLYTNFYGRDEHEQVARSILALDHPWIVTYDAAQEIQQLYRARRQYLFDINYSVQTKRIGSELLISSKGLKLPSAIRERPLTLRHVVPAVTQSHLEQTQ